MKPVPALLAVLTMTLALMAASEATVGPRILAVPFALLAVVWAYLAMPRRPRDPR